MSAVQAPSVTITPSAIAELMRIRQQEGSQPDQVVRVGVKGGGCSGLSYVLEFDQANDFDLSFEAEGLTFVLDQRHALYVNGMEVDYQNGLNDRGFIFRNPNAKESCGCGTSFSV
jgi:iron-sulfur cluster assembly accessory protein